MTKATRKLAEEIEATMEDICFYGKDEPRSDTDARVVVVEAVLDAMLSNGYIIVKKKTP